MLWILWKEFKESCIVSPISLDIVFKRINFTIQKGLAAQLIAHPKLFNFGCTIQNTFRNNASHNGAESGSKFAVVDNNTVCHYFKLQPLGSDRTAVVNLPQLNLNHWFRSNGPQLRHAVTSANLFPWSANQNSKIQCLLSRSLSMSCFLL
jgi:hypothetical protein